MEDRHSAKKNVLVVYHNQPNSTFNEDVFKLLKDNDFESLTLESDGMPNKTIPTNFIDLAKTAGKLLFIISNEFKYKSNTLQYLSALATKVLEPEHIVCLFKDCDIQLDDTISCLVATKLVDACNCEKEWQTALLEHLFNRRPNYTHFLGPAMVPSFLHHMHLKTFEIALKHKNDHLRIDLEKFQSHLDQDIHLYGRCDECLKLCPEETAVSVVYDDNFEEMKDEQVECLRMAYEVCKVWKRLSNIKHNVGFPIECTINGILRHFKFVRTLFIQCYQLLSSTQATNHHYDTEESRIASFPSSWSEKSAPKVEELAKAGFYYDGCPHVTSCYRCGVTIFDWSPKDNPLYEHAGRCGSCPFIMDMLPEDIIKSAQESCVNNEYKINENYCLLDSRKQSCEAFKTVLESANKAKVDEMSKCGFYFTGIGILFACFACGLIIRYTEGNIRTFHAKFSPTCSFMRSEHGEDYILDICSASDNQSSRTILTILPAVLPQKPLTALPRHFFMFIPSKASLASDHTCP